MDIQTNVIKKSLRSSLNSLKLKLKAIEREGITDELHIAIEMIEELKEQINNLTKIE